MKKSIQNCILSIFRIIFFFSYFQRKSLLALIMDWNVFFTSPGYSLVTNQILELLNYDSLMEYRKVSPIWKKYIDEQRFLRVRHLLSLMDKYFAKMKSRNKTMQVLSFGEKFPEWNKIIPFIKTEMSVSDMDKLIVGAELYTKSIVYTWNKRPVDLEELIDQVENWCPLQWAVHYEQFEFVEVMIRSPFDFNSLKFTFVDEDEEIKAMPHCGNCCDGQYHYREGYDYVYNNSVLHKAARNGDMKMIKLIFKYAEEKKIEINAKNDCEQSAIVTAKDDPEVVKLLMKHCKYPKSDVGLLGLKTLTAMAKSFVTEKHEPPKKEMKNSKK